MDTDNDKKLKDAFDHIWSAGNDLSILALRIKEHGPENPFNQERLAEAVRNAAESMKYAAEIFIGKQEGTTGTL